MLGASIVLYHSDDSLLLATVRAAAAQSLPANSLRIHANATSDDALAELVPVIKDAAGPLSVVMTSSLHNMGFAAAHNRLLAAHFADGCTAVLVLNPDLVLEPDALSHLTEAANALASPTLLGPVLELAEPSTMVGTGNVDSMGIVWTRTGRHLDDRQGCSIPDPLPDGAYEVAGISGACLYVSRAAYGAITTTSGEFFDEDFIAYREDAELGLRAAMLGVPSLIVPSARGRHARALRGTSRGSDPFVDRLGVRNRFLLAFKYGFRRPGCPPLILARDLVVLVGAAVHERSSWPGVVEAWRLRDRMRDKRRRLRLAAKDRS